MTPAQQRTLRFLTFIAILGVIALLFYLDSAPTPTPRPLPPMTQPAIPAAHPRIVTLAPVLSQMLVDMGKGSSIVGVVQFDALAPKGLPIVGSYAVNFSTEALLATHPTLVLYMAGKDAPPASLLDLQKSNIQIASFPSPSTIEEVQQILSTDSAQPCLEALFHDKTATDLRTRMSAQLDALAKLTANLPQPKTLIVIGDDPITAMGPSTVLGELLSISGATNAVADSSAIAPTLDREALNAAAPDVILFLMPSAPPLQPINDDPRLAQLKGLNIPAVTKNRIILISDPLALLPGSNIPTVAAEITKAVHPELAAKVDKIMSPHP